MPESNPLKSTMLVGRLGVAPLRLLSPPWSVSPTSSLSLSLPFASVPTGVCEKKSPPEKRALGKISLKSTKSGAVEEFVLLVRRAKAHVEEVFVHRHRYLHRRLCLCLSARIGIIPPLRPLLAVEEAGLDCRRMCSSVHVGLHLKISPTPSDHSFHSSPWGSCIRLMHTLGLSSLSLAVLGRAAWQAGS